MTRHANYYYDVAIRAQGELHGPDQITWINRLDADHPNILTSLSFLRDRCRLQAALEMAVALNWFWYRRGHLGLARQWLSELIEQHDDSTPELHARALQSLGWFTFLTGDWRAACKLYERSLLISRQIGDTTTEAYALSNLGVVERWLGNTDSGDALVVKAVQIARTQGSVVDLAQALVWAYATTGGVFRDCYPEAELKEAHTLALEAGDYWMQAHSYNGLGDLYCENGQYTEARSAYEVALQGFRRLEDRLLTAWTLEGMGRVETGSGNPMAALRQTAQALSVFDELGDVLNVGLMMARIVGILRELDPNLNCSAIAGAAAAMIGRHRRDDLRQAPQIDEASHHISGFEEAFPQEWLRGQSLSRADAVNLTYEQIAHLVPSEKIISSVFG
jgi:tetratricopeptide (TPR) repeat protein